MRNVLFLALCILIITLVICMVKAYRSQKAQSREVAFLLFALIPPILGNLIVVWSTVESFSIVGYYIYFLGMDLTMLALANFTFSYCRNSWKGSDIYFNIIRAVLMIDVISYVLNPFLHHVFVTQQVMVDGLPYFTFIPLIGQTYHRVVDYLIFLGCILIFLYQIVKSPKLYSERYLVIFLSMIFGGIWQSFYIFFRIPLDFSMIGFGIFGLLVFYFTMYYRPLRLLDKMLADYASQKSEALYFYTRFNRCIWANDSGLEFLGITDGDFTKVAGRLRDIFGETKQEKGDWQTQEMIVDEDGVRYYIQEKHVVKDDKGKVIGSLFSVRDNTEQQLALMRETYKAAHDPLTGIFNSTHLMECIRKTIDENPDTDYTIVFLDVDHFKLINDVFGRQTGDDTLKLLAGKLPDCVGPNGLYGRITADNFGLFMPSADYDEEVFRKQFSNIENKKGTIVQKLVVHFGVYEITNRELEVSVMFDRAHMAISTIKHDRHADVAYYDQAMRDNTLWGQIISSEVHEAIKTRQIVPYLQPITDSAGNLIGAEALVRWIHPTHGFLPPFRFIPVFEQNGLIADVDRHIWRCACELLREWQAKGYDQFISINISPKDFYFMDIEAELNALVKTYGISPEKLRVEITETVMMTDAENRLKMLDRLRKDGFIIEMDDFGSGYSSLNLLNDMPVDVLKIDMGFLQKKDNVARSQVILRHTINMAKDLGIVSLTEGVETASQFEMLSGMGCELFQGYYFSKPVPVDAFYDFCREHGAMSE